MIGGNTLYACARSRPEDNVDTARIKMHRLLMRPPPELVIDHIDCNGLNNQRSNLRVVPARMNIRRSRQGEVFQKPHCNRWFLRYFNREGARIFESGFDTAAEAWHRLRIVRAEMDLADLQEAAEIMAAYKAAA